MSAGRTYYRPSPWRAAVAAARNANEKMRNDSDPRVMRIPISAGVVAACYVFDRIRDDGDLSAAIRILTDAIADPFFGELLKYQLACVVQKAQQLHAVLDREQDRLAQAQEAAKALATLSNWVSAFNREMFDPDSPNRISEDDVAALARIQKSIDFRIGVATTGKKGDVNRRLGATRKTGTTDAEKDWAAAMFAIGELAARVKSWDGKPHTKTVTTIATALFDPDGTVFKDGLDVKTVEHARKAHEKIVREGGAVVRWDASLFEASWPPSDPPVKKPTET
jgi:hypothetical protein